MMKETKVLKVFKNEELGLEASVAEVTQGFSVALKDTDANEFVGICRIFKNEDIATDYAKFIANGCKCE
jgi:hypothetical protein